MNIHPSDLLTDALLAALAAAGVPVGDGEMPRPAAETQDPVAGWVGPAGARQFIPYVVVHSMPSGPATGTMHAPNDDAWPLYAVISHGGTRDQCEKVARRVRETVEAAMPLTVPGRKVEHYTLDNFGGADRDDGVDPPQWFCSDRFRFFSTPTTAA